MGMKTAKPDAEKDGSGYDAANDNLVRRLALLERQAYAQVFACY